MAKTVKKINGVKKSVRTAAVLLMIFAIAFVLWIAIGAFIVGVLGIFSFPLLAGILLGALILLVCLSYTSKRFRIYKAGVKGENVVGKLLSDLPKDYLVVRNAVITYEGRSSEIDHIVISEKGVIIIEAKHYSGTVEGDISDKYWHKTKISRGHNEYSKRFYNPVKQLGTQIHRLAYFLRENGINVFVEGAVCFTDGTRLEIDGGKKGIGIFSIPGDKARFLKYITDRKKTLSASDVEKIKNLLK